jgi:hypothetical protein
MVDVQTIGVLVTAASVSVAAIYYIFNMRTTLQTRQAQLFMQLYSQYYNKDWLEALRKTSFDINKTESLDEWSEKYGAHTNPEAYKSMDMLSHYFEGAGVLVKRGLIDPSMVSDLLSEELVNYWEKFGPMFKEYRRRSNNPRLCENQEYLYGLLKSKYPRGALTTDEVERSSGSK